MTLSNVPQTVIASWNEIRRHARLWRACLAMSIVRETQFRANFITTVTVGLVQLVTGLIPVLLIYSYTDTVDGWSRADAIVILGVFQLTFALLSMFISRNMYEMSNAITEGMLDVVLIRPVNAQFYLTTRWIRPDQMFNVLAGLVVIVIGLARSGTTPGVESLVQFALLLVAGFVLVTCCYSCLAFCAFWMLSVNSMIMFFRDLLQVGRYPIAFFPISVRLVFTFLVPLAFLTTFPAQAITTGISWWVVAGAIIFAIAAVFATRQFWRFAVRRYSGASS